MMKIILGMLLASAIATATAASAQYLNTNRNFEHNQASQERRELA